MNKRVPVRTGRPPTYTKEFVDKQGDLLLDYVNTEKLPLLKHFTSLQGYASQRLTEDFIRISEDFADTLKRAKEIMEVKWCYALAKREIEVAPGIFILKNISEMRDVNHIKAEGVATVINIIRANDGYKTQEIPGQLRVLPSAVPSNGIGVGNGEVALPDSKST